MTAQLRLIRNLRGLNPEFGSFNDSRVRRGRSSSSTWRKIRAWRSRPAGTGSSSCRRASSPETTSPPSRQHSTHDRCSGQPGSLELGSVPTLRRAGARCASAMRHPPRSVPSTRRHWRLTMGSSASGPRTARRTSRTAPRWSVPRSPASKAARSMPSSFTNRPSAQPAKNGFVHDEALANELAARFYAARGFETISHAYLRTARYCYLRWGADGKVRQLDELYPHLGDEPPVASATSTIGTPVEQLDLATVVEAVASGLGRDCPGKAARQADAHRARACRCRSRSVDSFARR